MSLCSKLPDGGHYLIAGRHDEIRHTSLSKLWDSQLVYIIHLATETGNCAWKMNKRSILHDLLWPFYKSEISNEVWISDTPQRWLHRHILTDYSTRYGQAPAVSTRVRLAKGRWSHVATKLHLPNNSSTLVLGQWPECWATTYLLLSS